MSRTTKLTLDALSDADITNVFLMFPSGWPTGPVSVGNLKIRM